MNDRRSKSVIFTLIAIAVVASTARGEDQPSPIALEVRGSVTFVEDQTEKQVKPIEQLTTQKVTLGSKASLLIVLPGAGRLERLKVKGHQPVQVTLSENGAAQADGLEIVKIPAQFPPDMLAALPVNSKGAAGKARFTDGPPRLNIEPISDSTVLGTKPTFAWPAVEGARTYEIKLFDGYDPVFSNTTNDPTLACPHELERGVAYSWEVTAVRPDDSKKSIVSLDEQPEFYLANEKVLKEANDLASLLDSITDERIAIMEMVALRYAELKLINEAIAVNIQLAELAPEISSFQVALYQLYKRAGRLEEANHARAAAEKLGFEFEKKK